MRLPRHYAPRNDSCMRLPRRFAPCNDTFFPSLYLEICFTKGGYSMFLRYRLFIQYL
jgi:hypothetical protein